jgi:hypothetical protein
MAHPVQCAAARVVSVKRARKRVPKTQQRKPKKGTVTSQRLPKK